jgi:microcystin-dependent protein
MEAYMSMITAFGCTFVIKNWGACAGALVPISQNNALFALLGTQFGGDGRTTFGLPDLRGRSPVNHGAGTGLDPVTIGQKGGLEYVTLTSANLPAHYHSVSLTGTTTAATGDLVVSTENASENDPSGNYLATTASSRRIYTDTLSTPPGAQQDVVTIPAQPVSVTGNTGSTGNSIETYTRSPYQGVNYQICMVGLFPPRN